ncbi:leucine-rich repeat protein [Cohnella massiliensis]|uniref:leucine-rich repeat protein n=1 Tax=Cohnella massiliensis TaxID=1816691 RepID=UPI0009BBA4C7|nr:leucine-rich repeat protein [Cohnella massiliensis]
MRKLLSLILAVSLLGGISFGAPLKASAAEIPKEFQEVLDYLNKIRRAVGIQELELDPYLTKAAQNHADYLELNGYQEGGSEDPSKKGFTGKSVRERATAAGYDMYAFVSEKIHFSAIFMGSPVVEKLNTVVENMMNSAYDRLAFLIDADDKIGIGVSEGIFVFVRGGPSKPIDSPPIMYPYDGQTGVETYFKGSGEFNPLKKFNISKSGFAISFSPEYVFGEPLIEDIDARLVNSKGEDVPFFSENSGAFFIYPKEELEYGETYTVTMTYGANRTITWSFTTKDRYSSSNEEPTSNSSNDPSSDSVEKVHLYYGVIMNGSTMLPMRDVFENLGATISWDNKTRTVTAQKDDKTIVLQVDSKEAKVNGTVHQLDVPAQLFNSKTMVPVRFASEMLGAEVGWDSANRIASVRTPDKELVIHVNATKISESDVAIQFTDPVLEKAVRDALYRSAGTISEENKLHWKWGTNEPVTQSDLLNLSMLKMDKRVNLVKDLNGLEYATNLELLQINNSEVSNVGPLGQLPSLEILDLGHNRIEDISQLTNLPSLKEINLSFNNISDPSPLSKLPKLVTYNLEYNNIRDARLLTGFKKMTKLSIVNNKLTDIEPLSQLTQLTSLDLRGNQITDVKPIGKLKQLTDIDLSDNQISDLSPFAELENLSKLDMSGNVISSLELLAKCTNLTSLKISRNQITDIKPLSELTQLKQLVISDNRVADLKPLIQLKQLKWLELRGNMLKDQDINPLKDLVNLEVLDLKANQIQNISVLKNIPGLKVLHLSDNKISDLDPLKGMMNLYALFLENNQISDLSIIMGLPKLAELGLSGNLIDKTKFKDELKELRGRLYYFNY